MPRRKGVKGLLLVGHEKVPHGFGFTGDRRGNTADHAGTKGLPEPRGFPNHGLLLLFLRYGTLDQAEGEGRTVHLWVF